MEIFCTAGCEEIAMIGIATHLAPVDEGNGFLKWIPVCDKHFKGWYKNTPTWFRKLRAVPIKLAVKA